MATILSITAKIDNVAGGVDRRRYGGRMPTEITVRGTFTAFQAPERGTVHATIAFEGPAMEPVYDRVARDLEAVKASVTPLKTGDHGPVTWWSAQQLRTWSTRPWNKDGMQLPLVHHASVDIEVKFRDFAALSRWVGQHVANTDGFRVVSTSSGRSPRSGARSCRGRPAPGRSKTPSCARSSMPTRSGSARSVRSPSPTPECWARLRPEGGASRRLCGWRRHDGGAPEIELLPEDIEVSATVDARFVGGDAEPTA